MRLNIKYFGVLAIWLSLSQPSFAQWWIGGNLHKKTGYEWRKATYANRLATSGDFMSAMINGGVKYQGSTVTLRSMDQLKSYAEQLIICMDRATETPAANNQKNSALATVCLNLMGWEPIN